MSITKKTGKYQTADRDKQIVQCHNRVGSNACKNKYGDVIQTNS